VFAGKELKGRVETWAAVMQCDVPGGICACIREWLRHACANMEIAAHANTLVWDAAWNRLYLFAMRY
jgi:hypothetical protein